jgi:hypothetical protein
MNSHSADDPRNRLVYEESAVIQYASGSTLRVRVALDGGVPRTVLLLHTYHRRDGELGEFSLPIPVPLLSRVLGDLQDVERRYRAAQQPHSARPQRVPPAPPARPPVVVRMPTGGKRTAP